MCRLRSSRSNFPSDVPHSMHWSVGGGAATPAAGLAGRARCAAGFAMASFCMGALTGDSTSVKSMLPPGVAEAAVAVDGAAEGQLASSDAISTSSTIVTAGAVDEAPFVGASPGCFACPTGGAAAGITRIPASFPRPVAGVRTVTVAAPPSRFERLVCETREAWTTASPKELIADRWRRRTRACQRCSYSKFLLSCGGFPRVQPGRRLNDELRSIGERG